MARLHAVNTRRAELEAERQDLVCGLLFLEAQRTRGAEEQAKKDAERKRQDEEKKRQEEERKRQEEEKKRQEEKKREEEMEKQKADEEREARARRFEAARRAHIRGRDSTWWLSDPGREFEDAWEDDARGAVFNDCDGDGWLVVLESDLGYGGNVEYGEAAALPSGLVSEIEGCETAVQSVAISTDSADDRWVVLFTDGSWVCEGHDELDEALGNHDVAGDDADVVMTALFDDTHGEPDGYFILWSNGAWASSGLPSYVSDALHAEKASLRFFSAGNRGRFFASFDDGSYYFWAGEDSNRLSSALGQLKSARSGAGAAKIRSVQWAGRDSYFVRYSYLKDWPSE